VRCENAHWHAVPTPRHTRPKALPLARRVEPECAARFQERQLQEQRLDGRGDRGAEVAKIASSVIHQERPMTKKTNNSLNDRCRAAPSAGPRQAAADQRQLVHGPSA
jgi:hypothetical protein